MIFAYVKQRHRLCSNHAVIGTFVLATQIVKSICLIKNFKAVAIFCGCSTAQFECDLVGNPEDRFSNGAAHTISWLGHFYEHFVKITIFLMIQHKCNAGKTSEECI